MFQPFRMKRAAVAGALALGMSIAVSSAGIVRASHVMLNTKCSTLTPCITGNNIGKGGGVEGLAISGIGVKGLATSGIGIEGQSTSSIGAQGISTSNIGILGSSSTSTGILGLTAATNGDSAVSGITTGSTGNSQGVYGRSSNGDGVQGHASKFGAAGVSGYQDSNGNGVYAESADSTGDFAALSAQADGPSTWIFGGYNTANQSACYIDPSANFYCSGMIQTSKSFRSMHVSGTGQHVLAYAAESASATLDDVGTAHMVSGAATVAIDRTFASTIDRNVPYHVFLTPMGDTRGLYVSGKSSSGFEVREAQGGRSTISFDYRIVARPIDAKNDRLPPAPAMRKPIKHVPSAH
jgi:hypothetical protein